MSNVVLILAFVAPWSWCVLALVVGPRGERGRGAVIVAGLWVAIGASAVIAWAAASHFAEAPGQAAVAAVALTGAVLWSRARYGLAAACWIVLSYLAAWPLGVAGPLVAVPLAVGMSAVAVQGMTNGSRRQPIGS